MRPHRRTPPFRPVGRVDSTRPTRHAVHVAQRDLKRLGEAIETRRRELGLTQTEFADRGELALATIQRVESGKINPRAKTWKGLDQGAGWPPGTSRSITEGGPIPVNAPDQLAVDQLSVIEEMATAQDAAKPDALVDKVADLVRVLGEDETRRYLESLVERTTQQGTPRSDRASGE